MNTQECQVCRHSVEDHLIEGKDTVRAKLKCSHCDCTQRVYLKDIPPREEEKAI